MSDNFGQRLRKVRKSKQVSRSMTQAELAGKAGLTPDAISHFEGGRRKPSLKNLIKLADGLEVSVDYLLGRIEL